MFKGKDGVSQEGASTSIDPYSRSISDCVELVWENGQIMMQGKARTAPISNNPQTIGPRSQDHRNSSSSKMIKFSTMDSIIPDFPMSPPSHMGLDQDVDSVPWLSYAMEEPLHNDYTSDILHELSGVTINDLPTENPLGYRERKSNFFGDNGHEKDYRGENSEVPQFLLPFQHSVPRSGISNISSNNAGVSDHFSSRGTSVNPSSLTAFTSLRLQKLDGGQPSSSSSGLTNFPYFSRPAVLSRASHVTVNPSERLENDDKRGTLSVNIDSSCSQKEKVSLNQSIMAPENENSKALLRRPVEELFSANQALVREDISRNIGSQNQPCDAPMSKDGASGERNMEPVIAASSVCSANSAERASNEPARNLKRKSRETTESSGPSEEVEEESVGAKKNVSARPGSKRGRAAEVHNLSERRRRDRINEKMRALQDLIPNCNKADKASMLDEAIEYLKSLQLQLQILSTGAGMYMQPMMLPPGMQPIHGPHMPNFAPMGLGMGLGMGYGVNMIGVNHGAKMVPFQGPHYPIPGTGPTFPGMFGSTLQAFPPPGQGLPMSMQQAPVVSSPISAGLLNMPIGVDGLNIAGTSNSQDVAPPSDKKDSEPQGIPCSVAGSNYLNQETKQASNEGTQKSASCRDQPQVVDPSEITTQPTNGKDAMLS